MPAQSMDPLSATVQELESGMVEAGWPAFRARQLFTAWWRQDLRAYGDLGVWPKNLRQWAEAHWPVVRAETASRQVAADGTTKTLVRLQDGSMVETVLLPHRYGWSVCVSTQVGCAMGCHFCASGLLGKERSLTAGEILEQVHLANQELRGRGGHVSRVDLMGIGEPLDNYAATVRFLRLIHEPLGFGLSYRHLTVSTSGLVPRILALADEKLPVTLAVSLHAPTDALRTTLMPVNRAYPLPKLMAACETYWERTRRRISYEYLLIDGVNDGESEARALTQLIGGFPCHVNLIPWNPVAEHPFRPSPPHRVEHFRRIVAEGGISCTVRRELGQEIEAACGQLRQRQLRGSGSLSAGHPAGPHEAVGVVRVEEGHS